jgi:hypothetical protein
VSGPGGGFAGQYTAWVRCSSPSRQAMPDLEDRSLRIWTQRSSCSRVGEKRRTAEQPEDSRRTHTPLRLALSSRGEGSGLSGSTLPSPRVGCRNAASTLSLAR